MSEQKEQENKIVDITKLSLADLYSLYNFVRSTENRPFTMGSGKDSKTLVRNRTNEIENELMLRAFGCDPFARVVANPVKIEGEVPEKIDLKKFNNERFMVVKDKKEDK